MEPMARSFPTVERSFGKCTPKIDNLSRKDAASEEKASAFHARCHVSNKGSDFNNSNTANEDDTLP